MAARFDLVERGWLPCLMLDGSQRDLGLRDALIDAHEVRELYDPSPLVTVALHRLLLAILHRSHDGPGNFDAWCVLWNRGHWDERVVEGYLEHWRHRFDLFDPERPFYQASFMDGAKVHPIAQLVHEAASANNATLFDHSHTSNPATLPASRAARCLVAAQAFAIGGGVSEPFNLLHAPLVNGYTVLVHGETLFETLALNLAPYNVNEPIARAGPDIPVWEDDEPRAPIRQGTPPRGLVDYLTWQSRRVHLLGTPDHTGVTHCQVRQNLCLGPEPIDPFKAYRRDEERGLVARNIVPDRALWRDSHALVNLTSETFVPPDIFRTLARIDDARRVGRVTTRPGYQFGVYGISNDKARIDLWRTERLPIPLAYLNDDDLRGALEDALTMAEDTGAALNASARQVARLLLSPDADDQQKRQPPKGEIASLVTHLGVRSDFWARLEVPFRRLMVSLPEDRGDQDLDERAFGARELPTWSRTLREAANGAFDAAVTGFDRSGRHLKAVTRARRDLWFGLARALGPMPGNAEVQDGAAD